MSASPAGHTPGRTPNGGAPRPPMIRRAAPADPLVRPKPKRPPQSAIAKPPMASGGGQSTNRPLPKPQIPTAVSVPNGLISLAKPQAVPNLLDLGPEITTSGFTSNPMAEFTDYPLFLSKKELLQGMRYHVARFHAKRPIDPRNEEEFTRPVRLHRRDPRAPAPGTKVDEPLDPALEEEMEKQALLKEQRDAQREADMAEVAPSVNNQAKRSSNKKKPAPYFARDETAEQKARSKTRYEEALPWHLEDFDNKETWVGNYEAALSETFAQIVHRDGKFHVTPLEKFYKFVRKRNFKTPENVEEKVTQREKQLSKDPPWLIRHKKAAEERQEREQNAKAMRGLFTGSSIAVKQTKRSNGGGGDDFEELDFDDANDDDDEGMVLEGDDDETKETEARIKRDQLGANVFDMKDERTFAQADEHERREREARKKQGKRVRKALMKIEKNHIYDTDSDFDPFGTESDSTDSEAERAKAEQIKKEQEDKKLKPTQTASGASTKGTNTPSNRASKHPDPAQRPAGLKRTMSPDASEASGNESARKKQKQIKPSSHLTTGINTPNGAPSRPRSPATLSEGQQKPALVKRPRVGGAGSGSDREGAASGAEMSDAGRKRIKLKSGNSGSRDGSPTSSRAASPSRSFAGRAESADAAPTPIPTADQIKAAIPPEGISMTNLLSKFPFKGSISAPESRTEFIRIVKANCSYDRDTKLLKPIR